MLSLEKDATVESGMILCDRNSIILIVFAMEI